MDSIPIQKLQTIKGSKNKTKLLFPRFIKFMLSVSSLGMFLSSPLWLPSTISFLKVIQAFAFGSKGLFIICNIIIAILIGESKLSKSFMQLDVYDQEYASRSRGIHKLSDNRYNGVAELEIKISTGEVKEEEDEEEEVYEEDEGLNKRVEAFIERVNKQRKLEAKLMDRCG